MKQYVFMFLKRSFLPLIFAFLFSFVLPLTYYYNNISEFQISTGPLLLHCFLKFLLITICLTFVSTFGDNAYKFIKMISFVGSGYLLITTFLFPIQVGLQDGKVLERSYVYGVDLEITKSVIIFLIVVLFYYFLNKVYKDIIKVSFVLTIFWVVFIVFQLTAKQGFFSLSKEVLALQRQEFFGFSKEQNIIVISFDAMQGGIINEILHESPELKNELEGFIFYPRAIGVSPTTYNSIRTTALGRAYPAQDDKTFSKIYTSDSIFTELASDYSISTAGYWNPIKGAQQINRKPLLLSSSQEGYLISSAHDRILPSQIMQVFSNKMKSERPEDEVDSFCKTDKQYDFSNFEALVENANISHDRKTIKLIHFVFTHAPSNFDRSCKYHCTQNYVDDYLTAKDQTYCGLFIFIEFIKKLKKIGAYNNSLIFFLGDHGAENYDVRFRKNIPLLKTPVQSEGYTVYGRYNPMLMVKPIGSHKPFKTSLEVTGLIDIAPTIAAVTMTQSSREKYKFDGVNLFTFSATRQFPVLLRMGPNGAMKIEDYRLDHVDIAAWEKLHCEHEESMNRVFILPDDFDPATYLSLYPDLQEASKQKENPLEWAKEHYIQNGAKEGRRYRVFMLPDDFDPARYLSLYPDLQEASKQKENPLEWAKKHYIQNGAKEGRRY